MLSTLPSNWPTSRIGAKSLAPLFAALVALTAAGCKPRAFNETRTADAKESEIAFSPSVAKTINPVSCAPIGKNPYQPDALSPYHQEILGQLIARVAAWKGPGKPTVVFDLDDTLFVSASRSFAVYQDLLQSELSIVVDPKSGARTVVATKPGGKPHALRVGKNRDLLDVYPDLLGGAEGPVAVSALFRSDAVLLQTTPVKEYCYQGDDLFKKLGLTNPRFMDLARAYWSSTFFTDEYVVRDRAVDGGARYVQKLREAGARIVYLTGRPEGTMFRGTAQTLQLNGFPSVLPPSVSLRLKNEKRTPNPDPHDDTPFKQHALETLDIDGPILGTFENDPENLNMMLGVIQKVNAAHGFVQKDNLPTAVFIDLRHKPSPIAPRPETVWIKDYLTGY